MITGHFREGHPRVTLSLAGPEGSLEVEFVLDTGFEGDLALPGYLASSLNGGPTGFRRRVLASGRVVNCPFYETVLEWVGGPQLTEVLILEGQPLLGTTMLEGYLLEIEVTEGGDVAIQPL